MCILQSPEKITTQIWEMSAKHFATHNWLQQEDPRWLQAPWVSVSWSFVVSSLLEIEVGEKAGKHNQCWLDWHPEGELSCLCPHRLSKVSLLSWKQGCELCTKSSLQVPTTRLEKCIWLRSVRSMLFPYYHRRKNSQALARLWKCGASYPILSLSQMLKQMDLDK